MTLNQQSEWDTEFNALCRKYNIAFACVLYISQNGPGEQSGTANAVLKNPLLPEDFERLKQFALRASKLLWLHEPELGRIVRSSTTDFIG